MNLCLLASSDPMDHVLPHALSDSMPWFTNHMLMLLVAAGVCLVIFPLAARNAALVPTGFTNLIDSVLSYLRTEVAQPSLKEDTDRFIPYVWTTFFFILVCNLLGMVPLEPAFLWLFDAKHIGGTATAGISVTAGLAVFAFIMIHVSGIWQIAYKLWKGIDRHAHDHDGEHGHHQLPKPKPLGVALVLAFFLYWWNFAPHVFKTPAGTPKPSLIIRCPVGLVWSAVGVWILSMSSFDTITGLLLLSLGIMVLPGGLVAFAKPTMDAADVSMWVFLLLLELIGALVKPFALAMRLMANMLAGHVVLGSLLLLIPAAWTTFGDWGVGVPTLLGAAALSVLELFVAFLQAYIFTFLTCMFIGASVHPEH